MESYSTTTTVRGDEEVEKAARKKGRAYLCLRCLHRSQKEYIDVKYRMEGHIMKDHLRRDEVPFYCSLCQFRCTRHEDLVQHLGHYKKHEVLAQQVGVDPLDTACLKANSNSYKIGLRDYLVYDKEESYNYWKSTLQKRQMPPVSGPDYLAQIVEEALGDYGTGEENNSIRNTPNQSVSREITPFSSVGTPSSTCIEDQTTVGAHGQPTTPRQPPSAGSTVTLTQTGTIRTPEFVALSTDDLRQVLTPVMSQLSSLVQPDVLCGLLKEHRENNQQLGSGNDLGKEETTDSLAKHEAAEEELTGKEDSIDQEVLLEQLLPKENKNTSRKRKADSPAHSIRENRSRSRSPSPVEITTKQIADAVRSGVVNLQERITDNTNNLHSLKESVKDLSMAVKELTSAIRQEITNEKEQKSTSQSLKVMKENRDTAKDRKERRKSDYSRGDKKDRRWRPNRDNVNLNCGK